MKLRVKHQHGNVWFSDNGHRAYLRGERPGCMIPRAEAGSWVPTEPHHIQRLLNTIQKGNYSFELVAFYKPAV